MTYAAFEAAIGPVFAVSVPVAVLLLGAALWRVRPRPAVWVAFALVLIAGSVALAQVQPASLYPPVRVPGLDGLADGRGWTLFLTLPLAVVGVAVNAVCTAAVAIRRRRRATESTPTRLEERLTSLAALLGVAAVAAPVVGFVVGAGLVHPALTVSLAAAGTALVAAVIARQLWRHHHGGGDVTPPVGTFLGLFIVAALALNTISAGTGRVDDATDRRSLGTAAETRAAPTPTPTTTLGPTSDTTDAVFQEPGHIPWAFPARTTTLEAPEVEADMRALVAATIRASGPLTSPVKSYGAGTGDATALVSTPCETGPGTAWSVNLGLFPSDTMASFAAILAAWTADGYDLHSRAAGLDLVYPSRPDAAASGLTLRGSADGSLHVTIESFCVR